MVVVTLGQYGISTALSGDFILLTLHKINQLGAQGATWAPVSILVTFIFLCLNSQQFSTKALG